MRKNLFIFSFFFIVFIGAAQSWAPNIGTYWYNSRGTDPTCCSDGYFKDEYYKDSLIAGNNCQAIKRLNYQNCSFCTQPAFQFFTYTNINKVVYVNDYLSSASVQTQTFDTLFYFNAPIGYQWHTTPLSFTANCSLPQSKVTVLDTGSRFVQGVNLKWQKVSVSYWMQFLPSPASVTYLTDTIYERFGYLKTSIFSSPLFCLTMTDVIDNVSLRCYGDNQLSNFKYGHNYSCDYVISVNEEKALNNLISVFPNPTNSELNIESELIIDDGNIIIYDTFGRAVLISKINTNKTSIDIQNYEAGIYFIEIKTKNGIVRKKIIKN